MMQAVRLRGVLRRAVAVLLLAVLLLPLVGCGYRTIDASDTEKTSVGRVGEYTVCYDELFYYTMMYQSALRAEHGEGIFDTPASRALYREELTELVYSAIVEHYAVLQLSAEILYTLEDVRDSAEEEVAALVEELGGMHDYKKLLHENFMTDRYMRFTYAVRILQNNLLYSYVNALGIIESDVDKIYPIIMDDDVYARTRHIAIFKDNGKSDAENRALLDGLKARLDGGEDLNALIEAYSEDESQDGHGYYFMHGEMPAEYEKAAFALAVGETSGIVETADAYFLIRREEKEPDYVMLNCSIEGMPLYDGYQTYTLLSLIEERKETLIFEPNDYCRSLDLTEFRQGIFFDPWYLLEIAGWILAGGAVASLIAWWCVVSARADRAEREQRKKKRSAGRRRP